MYCDSHDHRSLTVLSIRQRSFDRAFTKKPFGRDEEHLPRNITFYYVLSKLPLTNDNPDQLLHLYESIISLNVGTLPNCFSRENGAAYFYDSLNRHFSARQTNHQTWTISYMAVVEQHGARVVPYYLKNPVYP